MSLEISNKVSVAGNHVTLKAGYEDESIAAIFVEGSSNVFAGG